LQLLQFGHVNYVTQLFLVWGGPGDTDEICQDCGDKIISGNVVMVKGEFE
jgi:hypothetical protein